VPLTALASPAPAQTVDLLALTDPARDAVSGVWAKLDATVTSDPAALAQIEFPYVPPAEYDLRILFVRSFGDGDLAIICHGGDSQFIWRMGGRRGSAAGFGLVDRKAFNRNASSRQTQEWLITGQQQELIIQVRHESVSATLDETPVSTLVTNFENLSLSRQFQLHRTDTLGVSVDHDDLTIESAQVLEISGPGRALSR
jgi:hypothetical protein